MTKIIYFDICALILVAVIAFSIVYRKMTIGISNKLFILLVSLFLADIIFELWTVSADMHPEPQNVSLSVRYISHAGYLLIRNLTIPVFSLYLISLTDTWHKIRKATMLKAMLIAPYVLLVCLICSTHVTKLIFYINENYVYARGKLFPLVYVCSLYYGAIGLCYIFRYRKLFHTGYIVLLCSMYIMAIVAALLQCINPEWLVELFCSAVSLLLITITIQCPEEFIDSTTKLGKHDAYALAMKKGFINQKRTAVILVNISNYDSLLSILGYDFSGELLRNVAAVLARINKESKLHADLFYLNRGSFRLVVNESLWSKVDEAANKINSELKNNFILHKLELNLISYVCIAYCPDDISDFDTLTDFENNLCGIVPFSGRVLKASDIVTNRKYYIRNEIDSIIEDALANRKFSVYYQPIYSVEKKRFPAAEALLRLNNDKYGFILPDLIITAAEKSGAIHRIGDYVLEEVCRFISNGRLDELGLDYIEINLSIAQCMQTDLADKVLEIIRKYNVAPEKINLEITETAASYAQNIMMANLDKLTQAGVSFSLDDYGTGYSNIRSVASLPISIVKLDKTFVNEIDNPRMEIVLKNTIKMLKALNMEIVVEGIEISKLANLFAELECDYIQGYYYSRPVSERDFVTFMKNTRGVGCCER